jgi:dienelactone hydrolase
VSEPSLMMRKTRPEAYNAEAADAWQRTLKFFRERLGV